MSAPRIPVFDGSGRSGGPRSRADFEGDAGNDREIRPESQDLKQVHRTCADPDRGPTGTGPVKYRALTLACPSKPRCRPDADFGAIPREEHEDARHIAETGDHIASTKPRKKVEMPFAHLQRIPGPGRLRHFFRCNAAYPGFNAALRH